MTHFPRPNLSCVVWTLALFCAVTPNLAQDGPRLARVDERADIVVGKTVTIRSGFEGLPVVEPHIAAHPGDNNRLLVAAMVITDKNRPYESARLSSFASRDGGRQWTETRHDYWGYDPWVAILEDGQTAMTWLGTPGSFQGQFPIRFFSSADAGASWSPDVQTASGNHDGTKIATLGDRFYFTAVQFNRRMGADVVLYRREGAGAFEKVATVDGDGQRLGFCEPAILTDGTVVVPAATHRSRAWVHRYDPASGALSTSYPITDRPGGAGGYMRLVADNGAKSKFRDRLYFVRAVGTRGKHQGVWLNTSADGGKSWSDDVRIDRFAKSPGSKAIVATPAVNREGVVAVSWVDRQTDPEQIEKDLYVTVSLDGGESFQRPVRVTSVSSDPTAGGNADVANRFPGGGHYLGIAPRADGSFQLIWSDSRSGIFELQTANVRVK